MDSNFECRICLEAAKEPVVSKCGHLYCWSCINTWLSQNNSSLTCPVCKSGISKSNLIPIFTKDDTPDPRAKGEPRPKPRREDPQPNPEFNNQPNFAGLFNFPIIFSFGSGFFPLLLGINLLSLGLNRYRGENFEKILFVIIVFALLNVFF